MRTLFVSYRVTDLERSLRFYTALGYGVLGRVEAGDGSRLVILGEDGRRGRPQPGHRWRADGLPRMR